MQSSPFLHSSTTPLIFEGLHRPGRTDGHVPPR
jgi:hypothetical protein